MKTFVDYSGKKISLSAASEAHIQRLHAEIEIDQIKLVLKDPDEVRKSSYHSTSVLYYRVKSINRYICVIVKPCPDGLFISSAMTTSKAKTGEVIYVREK